MSNPPNFHHYHRHKYSILLFHQVNVENCGQNMEIVLQQAWDAEAHKVMVQEPWTLLKDGEFTTKSHPGFDSFVRFGNIAS